MLQHDLNPSQFSNFFPKSFFWFLPCVVIDSRLSLSLCSLSRAAGTFLLSIFFQALLLALLIFTTRDSRNGGWSNFELLTCTLGQAAEQNGDLPRDFATVTEFIDVQAQIHRDKPAVGFPFQASENKETRGYNVYYKFCCPREMEWSSVDADVPKHSMTWKEAPSWSPSHWQIWCWRIMIVRRSSA